MVEDNSPPSTAIAIGPSISCERWDGSVAVFDLSRGRTYDMRVFALPNPQRLF